MSSPTQPAPRPAPSVVETGEGASRSAYPTGNAIRRALQTLRLEGPRSVWFKFLSECGYRRLLLLERPLDEPIADFIPALPVDVAMLGPGEVDEYLAFRPRTTRGDIDDRLRAGQLCFVARHQGRVVAAAWLTMQPLWLSFLGCRIDVGSGEAHVYDKFTMPAYRGQGIANAVRIYHLRHLQRAGFRRATGAVLPENVSSLRDDAKGGFRAYGMLGRIKIGRWQRVFLMPPPRRRHIR